MKTTVNLPDTLVKFADEMAAREGVTRAQYIREALVGKVFFDLSATGGKDAAEVAELYRRAREAEPPTRRPSGTKEET